MGNASFTRNRASGRCVLTCPPAVTEHTRGRPPFQCSRSYTERGLPLHAWLPGNSTRKSVFRILFSKLCFQVFKPYPEIHSTPFVHHRPTPLTDRESHLPLKFS